MLYVGVKRIGNRSICLTVELRFRSANFNLIGTVYHCLGLQPDQGHWSVVGHKIEYASISVCTGDHFTTLGIANDNVVDIEAFVENYPANYLHDYSRLIHQRRRSPNRYSPGLRSKNQNAVECLLAQQT